MAFGGIPADVFALRGPIATTVRAMCTIVATSTATLRFGIPAGGESTLRALVIIDSRGM